MKDNLLQELGDIISTLETRHGFEHEASALHNIFMKLSQVEEHDTTDLEECPKCGHQLYWGDDEDPSMIYCTNQECDFIDRDDNVMDDIHYKYKGI